MTYHIIASEDEGYSDEPPPTLSHNSALPVGNE